MGAAVASHRAWEKHAGLPLDSRSGLRRQRCGFHYNFARADQFDSGVVSV